MIRKAAAYWIPVCAGAWGLLAEQAHRTSKKGGHGARAPLSTLLRHHRPPSGPITRSGRYVEMPGTKHSTTTAAIIKSTNGSVPQITSRKGMSGATLRMTKIFRPTGGGIRPNSHNKVL